MSRSNPTDGARNPSTRWFEWAGGADGGFVKFYDKEAKTDVKLEGPFSFLLLDELSTIKGWHEPSESAIYANEVRDLKNEALVVKSFKGGPLVSGFYGDIKDSIVAKGGHWHDSIYVAYKDGEELKIGNLGLKGAAAGAWMDFKKNAPAKKASNGKSVKAFYVDAVIITGYEQAKKGGTTYRVPKFALKETSAATNEKAGELDAQLQAFLTDYFRKPKAEAANGGTPHEEESDETPPYLAVQRGAKPGQFDDFESDIPF